VKLKKVIVLAAVAGGGFLLWRWVQSQSSAMPDCGDPCGCKPPRAPENAAARERWVECRVGREPTQAEATADPQAYRDWINAARKELWGRK